MSKWDQAVYRARKQSEDPVAWSKRRVAAVKKYRQAHPEKAAAHRAVARAIRKGILVRPNCCDHCKQPCKPQASHTNYEEQLNVEWLCVDCHARKDFGHE